jgi:hypothetical protein
MLIVVLITLIILLLYLETLDTRDEDCVCYNDHLNLYNLNEYKKDIQSTLEGNWGSVAERGIGNKNPYYKSGDAFPIQILGDASFQDTVKTSITTGAMPFINLKITFVTDNSAVYKISQGTPPTGYTGWTTGIGSKNPTSTLGNQRQMNILHELGHALGMIHENFNTSSAASNMIQNVDTVYGTHTANQVKNALVPAPAENNATTPFDIYSIMGIGSQFKRTQNYSDGDKLWLKLVYGEPGNGQSSGKSGQSSGKSSGKSG